MVVDRESLISDLNIGLIFVISGLFIVLRGPIIVLGGPIIVLGWLVRLAPLILNSSINLKKSCLVVKLMNISSEVDHGLEDKLYDSCLDYIINIYTNW